MQYRFQILTTDGLVESILESNFDFSNAPFGFVNYRTECSCDCSAELIEDFWKCVDQVLSTNNLTSSNYIRAVRAYTAEKICGESE